MASAIAMLAGETTVLSPLASTRSRSSPNASIEAAAAVASAGDTAARGTCAAASVMPVGPEAAGEPAAPPHATVTVRTSAARAAR